MAATPRVARVEPLRDGQSCPALLSPMPTPIDRRAVLRLLDEGAQLAEVLPGAEYDEEHLPGAIHVPLKALSAESARVLDPARPVIVYCWDSL